jgi:glycosyltransferase involved in cell wall biosynthesis
MIVRNESQVILRCLESVRPLLDYVLIEDTGSTDGTQAHVREWLARVGLAGEVVEEPWRDFATNRSHALACLRQHGGIDYAFIMDADDYLVPGPGFDATALKAGLVADMYNVALRDGGDRYERIQLCRNRLPFRYRGVLHEYLEAPPGDISLGTLSGFHIESTREGARNRDPAKYRNDAAMLERALSEETDPFLRARYTFYLARSYHHAGDHANALKHYLARAGLGYWIDEVFISLYGAGQMLEAMGRPLGEVVAAYLRASEALPGRAEALHAASRLCRSRKQYAAAYDYARRGLQIAPPPGGLFIEQWVYDYGLLDEVAVNAYWAGQYRDSLGACLRLLHGTALPAQERERVWQNAEFARQKLPRNPDLGEAGRSSFADQHALVPQRRLASRLHGATRVLLAILVRQRESQLPLYLQCIEALDYPKASIALHIRTSSNTDRTEPMLRQWLGRVGHLYAAAELDVTEWAAPGPMRDASLERTLAQHCQFYFVVEADNFIRPCTLSEMVALDLPIVGPLLRSIDPARFFSNFHAEIDANGYYKECDQYHWILNRWVRGVLEVPVVHSTYLVRAEAIPALTYRDATDRHEYVVFSDSARRSGIVQYIDNRQVYGYIALDAGEAGQGAGGVDVARSLLAGELGPATT